MFKKLFYTQCLSQFLNVYRMIKFFKIKANLLDTSSRVTPWSPFLDLFENQKDREPFLTGFSLPGLLRIVVVG